MDNAKERIGFYNKVLNKIRPKLSPNTKPNENILDKFAKIKKITLNSFKDNYNTGNGGKAVFSD